MSSPQKPVAIVRAKTSAWMEGFMPVGKDSIVAKPGSRLRELGLVLPKPPSPLGAYIESPPLGAKEETCK